MRVGHSRVPHPCATKHCCFVRLACLIHAASVRSEPGSNSPNKILRQRRSAPRRRFVLQDSISSQIFRFALLLRLLGFLQNLKIFSRVHRTIQFSKITCSYNQHRLHQAQWNCNLACFFRLSNRFLNFFQTFFSTAPHHPGPPRIRRSMRKKYSTLSAFVKSKTKNFSVFFHRLTRQPQPLRKTDH